MAIAIAAEQMESTDGGGSRSTAATHGSQLQLFAVGSSVSVGNAAHKAIRNRRRAKSWTKKRLDVASGPLPPPPHRQPEAAKSGQIIYNFARETDKAEGKRDFPPRNVNVCESVCVCGVLNYYSST